MGRSQLARRPQNGSVGEGMNELANTLRYFNASLQVIRLIARCAWGAASALGLKGEPHFYPLSGA